MREFVILQKLHVLSDIGISLLDAIGNTSVSRSHIPGLILLPSSLYKVGQKHISQASSTIHFLLACSIWFDYFLFYLHFSSFLLQGNSDLLIHYHQDESFIRKLLDSSKNKAQVHSFIPSIDFYKLSLEVHNRFCSHCSSCDISDSWLHQCTKPKMSRWHDSVR